VAGPWQTATVVSIRDETYRTKTFRLSLERPSGHRAGQHFVVKLTAPDGYTASRSYSVASPPAATDEIELTVERLDDGEVSGFLHDVVEVGDELDVRGPIGGYFVWEADTPALLLGGGSGIVPLMAMLRLARAERRRELVELVVSVRSPADLYYAAELPGPEVAVLYTREAPADTGRPPGRLTPEDVGPRLRPDATVYICGSAPFANAAGDLVTELGVAPERIRVERFGPSAGSSGVLRA
jgi:ferredoxin-NADP reductase